jgi:hypothetical protein
MRAEFSLKCCELLWFVNSDLFGDHLMVHRCYHALYPPGYMYIVLLYIRVLVWLVAPPRVVVGDLVCGGSGYASFMDTTRADLMATQWNSPPSGSFTIE